jgi:UDP-3-O-[3-hydroxymyristoyl] glucosamine N-acyltransferase
MAGAAGFTLADLAKALQARLEGDPARVVTGVATLDRATPAEISFVTHPRYRDAARASRAGAFLASDDVGDLPAPSLRCAAPQRALIELLRLFYPPPTVTPGVDPTAVVARGARVDPTAAIGPLTVVEDGATIGAGVRLHALVYVGQGAEIGAESVLYPHVTVRDGVRLGRRVIVHPGAVLGADGFSYVLDDGRHRKIPQVGRVVIEDDVEIGANAAVDRAMLGDTVIRRGTKVDNLVQIAHNCEVGEDCVIAAQVGIAGSSRIGRGVVLAGQVGVADHLTIGDGVTAAAQTGIHNDIEPGQTIWGTPARPAFQTKRIAVAESQLPELVRRVRALERAVDALTRARGSSTPADGDDGS